MIICHASASSKPSGRTTGLVGDLDRLDAVDAERSPTGVGLGDEIPRPALGGQAERMHGAGARRTLASNIAEHDLATRDHRGLHGVEMHRWRPLGVAVPAPTGGVVERPLPMPPRRAHGTAREGHEPTCAARRAVQVSSPAGRPAGTTPAPRPMSDRSDPCGPRPPGATRRCAPASNRPASPATPSESRSRRAVRSEISSSTATSAAVTWPLVCSINRIATRRSARTSRSSHTNRTAGDLFSGAYLHHDRTQ